MINYIPVFHTITGNEGDICGSEKDKQFVQQGGRIIFNCVNGLSCKYKPETKKMYCRKGNELYEV